MKLKPPVRSKSDTKDYARITIFVVLTLLMSVLIGTAYYLYNCRQISMCFDMTMETLMLQLTHPLAWAGVMAAIVISALLYWLLSLKNKQLISSAKVLVAALFATFSGSLLVASSHLMRDGNCSGIMGAETTCIANFNFSFMFTIIAYGWVAALATCIVLGASFYLIDLMLDKSKD